VTELERALLDLGRELDVPAPPDVSPAVLARIERRGRVTHRFRRRRVAIAVALAVLAAVDATLAVPDARSALFRVLHIGGERIEFVAELPAISPDEPGLGLDVLLGERVSLEEARRRAAFPLRELDEPPDRAYVGPRETIWFLYGSPERVRLLVAQTPLFTVDEIFIRKKLAGAGTRVDEVSVRGTSGFFIGGAPHALILLDESGAPVEESFRLARHVLVWEEDGVAFRLEGDFTRDQALELAASLD
jgi:hypothetical protein